MHGLAWGSLSRQKPGRVKKTVWALGIIELDGSRGSVVGDMQRPRWRVISIARGGQQSEGHAWRQCDIGRATRMKPSSDA